MGYLDLSFRPHSGGCRVVGGASAFREKGFPKQRKRISCFRDEISIRRRNCMQNPLDISS